MSCTQQRNKLIYKTLLFKPGVSIKQDFTLPNHYSPLSIRRNWFTNPFHRLRLGLQIVIEQQLFSFSYSRNNAFLSYCSPQVNPDNLLNICNNTFFLGGTFFARVNIRRKTE